MGKTLGETQKLSRNGFFPGKHHPVPAVCGGVKELLSLKLAKCTCQIIQSLQGKVFILELNFEDSGVMLQVPFMGIVLITHENMGPVSVP